MIFQGKRTKFTSKYRLQNWRSVFSICEPSQVLKSGLACTPQISLLYVRIGEIIVSNTLQARDVFSFLRFVRRLKLNRARRAFSLRCSRDTREVKHHVYVKRQMRICTTWPSFPFTCRLLLIISTHKLVVLPNFFAHKNSFELFFSAYFLFWEILNLNLTFAVYVKLKLSTEKFPDKEIQVPKRVYSCTASIIWPSMRKRGSVPISE